MDHNDESISTCSPDPTTSDSKELQAVISKWEDVSQAVDSALNRLHFLAAAIRKASAKKLEYNIATFLTDEDIVFRRDAGSLVRFRFPSARKSLCQQLGDSIAVRRRMLLQKHRHAKKLTVRRVVDKSPPVKQRHNSEPDFRPVVDQAPRARMLRNFSVPASGVTKASRPDPRAPALRHLHLPRRPALSTVISTISTTYTQQDSFEYPSPPKANEGETRTQCPYCLMPLDNTELRNNVNGYWARHIDEDIKPYACLFPECAKALVFFTRRHEWKSHMDSVHSKDWMRKIHATIWYCDIDHDVPEQFETELQWKDHMKNLNSHPNRRLVEPTKAQLDALSPRKQQVALRDRFVCPLCELIPERIRPLVEKGLGNPVEGDEFMIDHVANHIKSLSLLSLPCLDSSPAALETDGESVAMEDSFKRLMNQDSVPRPPSGIGLLDGDALPPEVWSTLGRDNLASLVAPGSESAWDTEFTSYVHPEAPPVMLDDGWLESLEIWKEDNDPFKQKSNNLDPVLVHLQEAQIALLAAEAVTPIELGDLNMKSKDEFGRTLLSRVVATGNEYILKILLASGGDIEDVDQDGRTPLLSAAENGHESIVRVLLDKGARIEATDQKYGMTSLSWAATKGHEDVVQLLLDSDACIDAPDNSSRTPLSWAASRGHEAIVKLLLEKSARIEASDQKYGRTPLSWAAARGHVGVVRLLLQNGANIEAVDKEHGRGPLSWAAEHGYESVAQILLDAGADTEATDQVHGRTPLSFAAEEGHVPVVKLLIEHGARVDTADQDGRTPLWWAEEHGHDDISEQLRATGR